MKYDIIHVEDNEEERRFVGEAAARQNLTYLGLSCLQALENSLPNSSARIFVIDGKFPVDDGGIIERNASRAIAAIRLPYPQARMVLYSSEMDIDTLAGGLGVDHRSKSKFTARGLVTELVTILK